MKVMKALSDLVRQIAYDIHVYHAHGHLEKVYENALAHRLRKAGLDEKACNLPSLRDLECVASRTQH